MVSFKTVTTYWVLILAFLAVYTNAKKRGGAGLNRRAGGGLSDRDRDDDIAARRDIDARAADRSDDIDRRGGGGNTGGIGSISSGLVLDFNGFASGTVTGVVGCISDANCGPDLLLAPPASAGDNINGYNYNGIDFGGGGGASGGNIGALAITLGYCCCAVGNAPGTCVSTVSFAYSGGNSAGTRNPCTDAGGLGGTCLP